MEERANRFAEGQWLSLLVESNKVASDGSTGATRRRRHNPSDETKALRAERLASLGELSAARQALEGAEIAPGTLATLAELTNPDRRPARPREVVLPNLMRLQPDERIQLDEEMFAENVRSARRGAVPGPSGMTAEHLFPLLESTHTLETLCEVAGFFARP